MNRRSFLGALAAVMAAPRVLAGLACRESLTSGAASPALAPVQDYVTATEIRRHEAHIRRTPFPSAQWRQLDSSRSLMQLMNERNEILDNMLWTLGNRT